MLCSSATDEDDSTKSSTGQASVPPSFNRTSVSPLETTDEDLEKPRSETVIEEPEGAAKSPGCFACIVPKQLKHKPVEETSGGL